jgi:gamma-glutamylcyclotransferase (GGCT)/AIG2-like uncharacterized protein YtfP
MTVEHRLAVYGSLGPGRDNNHQLSMMNGHWTRGEVRGRRVDLGWGSALGFPGVTLDPAGEAIAVDVLISAELPNHWARLDAFEGAEYRRVATKVATPAGELEAYVYVLANAD